MLIKLTGADFSADNIGKVTILHALTKNVFAHQTRFTIASPQAIALNNLFWVIDSLGINIGTFVSPWLAGSLTEAVYDSVNDTSSTPPSGYTMSNGLLTPSSNGQTISLPTRVSPKNWFLVFRDALKDLNGIISNSSTANVNTMANRAFIGKRVTNNASEAYWIETSEYYTLYEINSLNNLTDDGSLYINGSKPTQGSETSTTINSAYMSGFMPSFTASNVTRMLFLAGDGNTVLTSEQRTGLMEAASELANVLIANETV